MTRPMLRTAIVASAFVVASATSALALDARIRVSDLNLSSPAHRAELESRIAAVADRLCRDALRPGSRLSDRAWCEAQVRAEAYERLETARAADAGRRLADVR